MNWRQHLAQNLAAESEAYGYTLSIWGGGAILIHQYSTPNIIQIYLYVSGALVGFAALALLAFPHLFTPTHVEREQQPIIASSLHLIATFGSLLGSHLVATATGEPVRKTILSRISRP